MLSLSQKNLKKNNLVYGNGPFFTHPNSRIVSEYIPDLKKKKNEQNKTKQEDKKQKKLKKKRNICGKSNGIR